MRIHIAILAMVAMLSGCDREVTCARVCAMANACPGASAQDCGQLCGDADALNVASSCREPYRALLECSANQPDPCTAKESACSKPTFEYGQCLTRYCSHLPLPPLCTRVPGRR